MRENTKNKVGGKMYGQFLLPPLPSRDEPYYEEKGEGRGGEGEKSDLF